MFASSVIQDAHTSITFYMLSERMMKSFVLSSLNQCLDELKFNMDFPRLYSYNQQKNCFSKYSQEVCPFRDLLTNLGTVDGVNKVLNHYQLHLLSNHDVTKALPKVHFQRKGASLYSLAWPTIAWEISCLKHIGRLYQAHSTVPFPFSFRCLMVNVLCILALIVVGSTYRIYSDLICGNIL